MTQGQSLGEEVSCIPPTLSNFPEEDKLCLKTKLHLKKEQTLNDKARSYACCKIQAWILFCSNVSVTFTVNIGLEGDGELAHLQHALRHE